MNNSYLSGTQGISHAGYDQLTTVSNKLMQFHCVLTDFKTVKDEWLKIKHN